ncbi:hypothetical protein DERP_008124 [Dermatophagoides pteronyssinus]|uniref:Dihydrofolate reductase n=1 Tax=Dermatophagoides pteronyssinus TaxID=6956 RepID=A0ABQ8JKL6_DERPT|nr:hypothetical protein DERP_008124 [Dermatophagoides pteronyssinus]
MNGDYIGRLPCKVVKTLELFASYNDHIIVVGIGKAILFDSLFQQNFVFYVEQQQKFEFEIESNLFKSYNHID